LSNETTAPSVSLNLRITLTISLATTSWTKSFTEFTFELSAQLLSEIPPPLSQEAQFSKINSLKLKSWRTAGRGIPSIAFVKGHQRILICNVPIKFLSPLFPNVEIRWDEEAGLRRDAVGSQVIDVL
jgi:hypothetical protein